MMGRHRDEAAGDQDRGVKEDREGQEDQQRRDKWEGKLRACSENTLRQS